MKYSARDYTSAKETLFGIQSARPDGHHVALFRADGKLYAYATAAERDEELARLNGTAAPKKPRAKAD
ncbi:MAG: hypothetical protein FWD62_01825 [Betaproteobacteria bacterium]|nr:hypothetical protein [Betaproteobacteria bacterium]